MNIIVADGILYLEKKALHNYIDARHADKIANANGYEYVERFVKAYPDGTELKLNDETLKVMD